jgi:hypothetical protein
MPQFWIAIFFMLLAAAQLYESIKKIELPLPVYLVLGTILAIASNFHQESSLSSDRSPTQILPQATNTMLSDVTAQLLASAEDRDLHKLDPID